MHTVNTLGASTGDYVLIQVLIRLQFHQVLRWITISFMLNHGNDWHWPKRRWSLEMQPAVKLSCENSIRSFGVATWNLTPLIILLRSRRRSTLGTLGFRLIGNAPGATVGQQWQTGRDTISNWVSVASERSNSLRRHCKCCGVAGTLHCDKPIVHWPSKPFVQQTAYARKMPQLCWLRMCC